MRSCTYGEMELNKSEKQRNLKRMNNLILTEKNKMATFCSQGRYNHFRHRSVTSQSNTLARDIIVISINFQVTIDFLAIWLVEIGALWGNSYWLPSDYIAFCILFKMAAVVLSVYFHDNRRQNWENKGLYHSTKTKQVTKYGIRNF